SSGILRAGDSPGECLPLADTNSRTGGGFGNLRGVWGVWIVSGGLVEVSGDATALLRSSRCELAKLVVGMARQPPTRVNSFLDQRLDSASTVQEVLTAGVAPHRLPPQEADELVRLRDEVSRLQTRCEDAERGLANEVQLRTAAEADSVRSTEDFYTMHDANQSVRTENEELVAHIRELDITVAERAHGVQRLKDRCRSYDADCAAAMRYVTQEHERMKAGLAVYNAELTKLRQYLEEHDRGKVYSPSPRMKALLAENAGLRRANSMLRQNSAEHDLNTDVLILSTAGLSASGLDWELLGWPPASEPLRRLGAENALERELADDDFMLGLTNEGSVAETSTPPQDKAPVTIVPADAAELLTVTSVATISRKLPANAERFLKPGVTAVGAQKAWCKMLNVSLSAPTPNEHSPPLDFAFLALMHNVRSSRHRWRVLYGRMPDEPLTFSLGKLVKCVRISIRASGLRGLVRMRRRFSGHCYEGNEKVDLCVAL
ncbi:LOW QUALITY PROTEIN: hypothetical protein PHMEG_00012334, partial [Phytophthora megakarya]